MSALQSTSFHAVTAMDYPSRHPIFKGCTRPPMFMGVPLMPFLLLTGAYLIAGVWGFYLISPYASLALVLTYVPLIAVLRQITKRDDQRLRQLMLRARMRLRHGNTSHWGALSYCPLRLKQRQP